MIPSVDNFHKFAIPAIRVIMVLLSYKFHMNFYFHFLHIVNNSVLFTSYFSLSGCVCFFRTPPFQYSLTSFFGINLKERKKECLIKFYVI